MSLLFFYRYLFSARSGSLIRRIAWLSFIGVFFGIFAFILILSIMQGLNHGLHKRILAVDPHVRVNFLNADLLAQEDPFQHPVYQEILKYPELRVRPFEEQEVILRSVDGLFRGAVARGITGESFKDMLTEIQNLSINSNTDSQIVVEAPEDDKIVIGVELARSLGSFEGDGLLILSPESLLLPAGDVPKFFRVVVNQILATNLPDVDAGYLFYQKGQGLSRLQKAGQKKLGFEIWGKDPYDSDKIRDRLKVVPGIEVQTWQERNSALFSALRMERLVIGLFLGIAALITCFSVVSVMTLLVSQKRKEIGLLRAIGFSENTLKRLFLQIGIFLSGIGILVGMFLGTGLSTYIELNPLRILPDIYYDSEIPAFVNFTFIFTTGLVAFAVTYFSIVIILRRAFKEAPSELLKGI